MGRSNYHKDTIAIKLSLEPLPKDADQLLVPKNTVLQIMRVCKNHDGQVSCSPTMGFVVRDTLPDGKQMSLFGKSVYSLWVDPQYARKLCEDIKFIAERVRQSTGKEKPWYKYDDPELEGI